MFDPPHLLKCIRNNLMNYTFKFGQYSACWKDIEDFYEKDKILPIRTTPRLTDKHINPSNFQKMKVKYATQVLNHTVAASICTFASMGGLPASSLGTAELLSKFGSLFDCINSSTINSVKEFKSAISTNNSHITFLKQSITFIQGIKVFNGEANVTTRIKSLKGWLVTFNAIICIWNKLQASHNFPFLFTRRLNTDPLENFFGSIRQQGGNCDNPTPIQFTRAFRKLFFSSLLTSSKGNCVKDVDVLLAQFSKTEKRKAKNALFAQDVTSAQTKCQLDKLITENKLSVQTYSRRMLLLMFLVTCSTSPLRPTAAPIAKKYLYPTILMTIKSSFVSLKHIKNQTLVA